MCGLRMCATLMAPYYIAVSGWLTCATGPVEGSGRGPGQLLLVVYYNLPWQLLRPRVHWA